MMSGSTGVEGADDNKPPTAPPKQRPQSNGSPPSSSHAADPTLTVGERGKGRGDSSAGPAPSERRSGKGGGGGGKGGLDHAEPRAGPLLRQSNLCRFLARATPCLETFQRGSEFRLRDVWRFYDRPYGFAVPVVVREEETPAAGKRQPGHGGAAAVDRGRDSSLSVVEAPCRGRGLVL